MDQIHSSLQAGAILVVTGAHLQAETQDRPWAYWLRERILEELGDATPESVVVCSDLWVLNQPPLRSRPTIAVGAPEFNALSAYLAPRLPSVLAVDGRFVVLMHEGPGAPNVCCWGKDADATGAAVEGFAQRHLEEFLDAAGLCGR